MRALRTLSRQPEPLGAVFQSVLAQTLFPRFCFQPQRANCQVEGAAEPVGS